MIGRFCIAIAVLFWALPAIAQPVSETGLPLPRYASLKSSEVNLRVGPGQRYPVKFVYQRRSLPVTIINEYGHWRHILDFEEISGWVHKSMLSGKHTAIVTAEESALRAKPTHAASIEAKLRRGVITTVDHCSDAWCEVEITNFTGWLPRDEIYPMFQ